MALFSGTSGKFNVINMDTDETVIASFRYPLFTSGRLNLLLEDGTTQFSGKLRKISSYGLFLSSVTGAEGLDLTPTTFELGGPYEGEPDEIIYSNEITLAGVTAAIAIPATMTGGHGGCCRIERFNGSTWDNLGTSTDLYLGDVWRLRTRAHETPAADFILTATVGGVTDTMTVSTNSEAGTIPTPVIAFADGRADGEPLAFKVTNLVPDDVVGLDWFLEIGGGTEAVPDFTDGPGAETAPRTERRQITYEDFTGNMTFDILASQVAGVGTLRLSIKADDGTSSGLSNVLADDVVTFTASTLDRATFRNSPYYATMAVDDMSITTFARGESAVMAAKSTEARDFDCYFEVHVSGTPSDCYIGFATPAQDTTSVLNTVDTPSAAGRAIGIYISTYDLLIRAAGVTSGGEVGVGTLSGAHILGAAAKGGKLYVSINGVWRGASPDLNNSTKALPAGPLHALVGGTDSNAQTYTYVPSGTTYSPPTGTVEFF